jgi:DNA-binding transcriptional regulator GbsR (MarR family)
MNTLSPVQQKFVLHWGEMGARWGINRTVAQIHALLFISPKPLNAEDIAAALAVARSNVSTSLRELQNWGIIKVVHVLGDRREYYDSIKDVWEMFRIVIEERKKREIDPTVALLRECVAESQKAKDNYTRERLSEMRDFFETMSNWYVQISQLPTSAIRKFVKMGDRLRSLFGLGGD